MIIIVNLFASSLIYPPYLPFCVGRPALYIWRKICIYNFGTLWCLLILRYFNFSLICMFLYNTISELQFLVSNVIHFLLLVFNPLVWSSIYFCVEKWQWFILFNVWFILFNVWFFFLRKLIFFLYIVLLGIMQCVIMCLIVTSGVGSYTKGKHSTICRDHNLCNNH